MQQTKMFNSDVTHKIVGIVREKNPKSGPTWSRFKIQLDTGRHAWCVCNWPVDIGEIVVANATFNSQYKSYDLIEVLHDHQESVSNAVVIMKLCENLQGVGVVKAGKLGEKFPNLYETVINDPHAIVAACGAKLEDVVRVGNELDGQKEVLTRLTLLKKAHWPDHLAKRIVTSDQLYRISIKSPYAAIPWVEGLGWLIADEIGSKQKIAIDAPERIAAGIDHVYRSKVTDDGHTKAPRWFLNRELERILSLHETKFRNTLDVELIPLQDDWMCSDRNRRHASTIMDFFCK
jgi:hypothetical protein